MTEHIVLEPSVVAVLDPDYTMTNADKYDAAEWRWRAPDDTTGDWQPDRDAAWADALAHFPDAAIG